MKVILTEKITKLGNIGDAVEVKTGYARNYLLPNGKAMRFTRENVALFEARKAELTARQEAAKKSAESNVEAVKNAKAGQVRYRNDKQGNIQAAIGKVSFKSEDLVDNLNALISAIKKQKPATAKGQYIKKVCIASTMGAGVALDRNALAD